MSSFWIINLNIYGIIVFSISTCIILVSYYFFFVAKKPKVLTGNQKMRNFLKTYVPIIDQVFYPNLLFWEGHVQTYFGLTKRTTIPHRLPFNRTILTLSDGGTLALDTLEPSSKQKLEHSKCGRIVVLILPGVSSSSRTSYMRTLALSVEKAGALPIIFNNRGFAGLRLTTPRTHSARNVEDLREVITHLRNVYPDEKIMAIGTSLGGVVLCHYLMDYPEEASDVFVTALLLSTVFDYYGAMTRLEQGWFRREIINYSLSRDLVYRVVREKEMFSKRDCWDWSKIEKCRTGREFDTYFHVPQWNYSNAEEYWIQSTVKGRIHRFPIPVFSLNAEDDPMMPGSELPIEEALSSQSNLVLIVTASGGHLGFLEGISTSPKEEHYMERFTTEFVQAIAFHSKQLQNI